MNFYGREQELQQLMDCYDHASKGKPQMAFVLADSGLGKTRLVQEFYEKLAREKNADAYWPKQLSEKKNTMTLIPEMKDLSIMAYEKNEWMWLAIRCEETMSRNTVQNQTTALEALRNQVAIHVYPLMRKMEKKENNKKALRASLSVLASFAFPGGNVVAKTVDNMISTADSSLGMYENLSTILSNLHKEKSKSVDEIVGGEYNSIIQQSIDAINIILNSRKEGDDFTCIIIVDDAQWIDPYTIEFIQSVFIDSYYKDLPVMFLFTMWESSYKQQLANGEANCVVSMLDSIKKDLKLFPVEEESITMIPIAPLDREDVKKILNENLPGIRESLSDAIYHVCDGDLEMMMEYVDQILSIPGIISDGKVVLPEDYELECTEKREKVKRKIINLEDKIKTLLLCASVEGITFSKEFVDRCFQELHIEEPGNSYSSLDNIYNITKMSRLYNGKDIAQFRRQIYFDIADEMMKLAPFNQRIKRVVFDYYYELISEEDIRSYDHDLQKKIYQTAIHLAEDFDEMDEVIENSKVVLCQLYLQDGYFKECIELGNTIDDREIGIDDQCAYLVSCLEAALHCGEKQQEVEFLTKLRALVTSNIVHQKTKNIYLYYEISYLTRTNATKSITIVNELRENIHGNYEPEYFKYYLICVRALFYADYCYEALAILKEVEEHYQTLLGHDDYSYSSFYHTAGLVYHNMDMNEEICKVAERTIEGYQLKHDFYDVYVEQVNYADALMAVGKLIESEEILRKVYRQSKSSPYVQAYNISNICYANTLACLGKTSVALSFYEEAYQTNVKIEHEWDSLYGDIWRCLALADFHDPTSIQLLIEYEAQARELGYDYLVNLSVAFKLLAIYRLGVKLPIEEFEQELGKLSLENVPGLRLQGICVYYLIYGEAETKKEWIQEVSQALSLCTGVKGRPQVIKQLYELRSGLFEESQKESIEHWIERYVAPYLYDFMEVERKLEAMFPTKPLLKPCDMSVCKGYCCYDGVYISDEEEKKLRRFIKKHGNEFPGRVNDYFMTSSWMSIEHERKTAVVECQYPEDFPSHFNQTKCIFEDENGLCRLQCVATREGLHPWAIKPKACWLFPMDIKNKMVSPPPCKGGKDRDYVDESYPGYITFLHCGKDCEEGTSWVTVFKQEILYYLYQKNLLDF